MTSLFCSRRGLRDYWGLGGGTRPGSSSLCYMHICHNPEGQITGSQQARSWWPTSKSAEASLGFKSFQFSHFSWVGGPSIPGSGLGSFSPGLLLCTQCPAETNGDSDSPDALDIPLRSSLCCLASCPRPPPPTCEKKCVFPLLTPASIFLAHSFILSKGGSKYPPR